MQEAVTAPSQHSLSHQQQPWLGMTPLRGCVPRLSLRASAPGWFWDSQLPSQQQHTHSPAGDSALGGGGCREQIPGAAPLPAAAEQIAPIMPAQEALLEFQPGGAGET